MDLVEWRLTSHNIMLQRAILRMYKDCGWLVVTDMFFSLQTPPNASTATASSSSSGEYSSVTSLHVSFSLFCLCFLKPYVDFLCRKLQCPLIFHITWTYAHSMSSFSTGICWCIIKGNRSAIMPWIAFECLRLTFLKPSWPGWQTVLWAKVRSSLQALI